MKSVILTLRQGLALVLALIVSAPAMAWNKGDWLTRFGVSVVEPQIG